METITMLIAALVTIVAATLIASVNEVELRTTAIIIIAAITYLLSQNYTGMVQSFFTNLSTELVGTAITAVILGAWLRGSHGSYFLIVAIVLVSIAFIEQAGDHKEYILNLSTELLGAVVIFVLIHNDWFWGKSYKSRKEEIKKRRNPYR